MYGQSKKILTLLITSFITSIVVACILLGEMIRETKWIAAPFPDSPGHFCTPTATWPLYYTLWIPLLSFETLLFGLALFKGYQSLRSEVRTGWSGRCVLNILIRDSIMYFFILFATYLTNMLIWTLGGTLLAEVPVGFASAMPTVMTQRLLLNVRQYSFGTPTDSLSHWKARITLEWPEELGEDDISRQDRRRISMVLSSE